MKTPTRIQNKPGTRQSPVPDVPPGQERPNEKFRAEAEARTEATPPNTNAHIQENAATKDRASPGEKDRRNPADPKRGFDRGDGRSQPDNYHPYPGGKNAGSAENPKN